MKAVIVEISGAFVAALSDDGCITKIKNNNYAIGQVIEMAKLEVSSKKNSWLLAVSAIAGASVMALGIGAYGYMSPYTYVSIDVNPSIEYVLNRFDRVIEVTAVNDDGKKIVEEINAKKLNNKKIDKAIETTLNKLVEDGFLVEDKNNNLVYIATYGKNQQKAEKLATDLDNNLAKSQTNKVVTQSVTKERVEEAKNLGVTPGKLNLVQKLHNSAVNPNDVKIEEWLNKSVREIMLEAKRYNRDDIDDLYDDLFDDDDFNDFDDFDDDDFDDIYDDDYYRRNSSSSSRASRPISSSRYDDDDFDDIYDDDYDDIYDDDYYRRNSSSSSRASRPISSSRYDDDDFDDIYDDDYDDIYDDDYYRRNSSSSSRASRPISSSRYDDDYDDIYDDDFDDYDDDRYDNDNDND